MRQSQSFTQGRIFLPLIRFALPVLLALFLQTMYGAVDLLVVGQYDTSADVSAVATGSMVLHTMTVVITGLAMGITVLVGRKIGEGQGQEAGRIIGSGIWVFGILAIVLSVGMVFASSVIAAWMNAPRAAFSRTVEYIAICSGGTVFIVAYNLLGSVFRGIGDSVMPLVTVAIACVMNIAGDLLLVAHFQMGAAGAAIATVFAQMVSVLLSLLIIRKRGLPFTLRLRDIRPEKIYIRQVLVLGTPIALQDFLVSLSFLAITAIVNAIGLTESAGVGVAEKLCGFVMLVPSAYMQSMSAFVAQNIGAGKPERARKALWCGIVSSLAAGALIGSLTFFYGDVLAGIFAKEAPVIAAAWEYLRAYAIDCLLTAFLFCFIGYFNGTGNTFFVMLQGIVGAFCIRVPLSWLISRQAGASLFQIGLATPASTMVQIVACGVFFLCTLKKSRRTGSGIL